MFRLMIKQHNVTGLKYLCITKRKDYENYTGSGVYWKNHLKTHGIDFQTEVLHECEDYETFVDICNYYSEKLDVVMSSDWANIVPETGYNNNDGSPNVVLFWVYADQATKDEIVKKRNESIKKGHYSKKDGAEMIYEVIAKKNKQWWATLSEETKHKIVESLCNGRNMWYNGLSDTEKISIYERTLGKWLSQVSKEELSVKNRSARLNTSTESKDRRKQKIQEVYKTGKHDEYAKRLSVERSGAGNPMYGVNIWKDKGEVSCPHCNKTMNDSPAARRWHFDNCKNKELV